MKKAATEGNLPDSQFQVTAITEKKWKRQEPEAASHIATAVKSSNLCIPVLTLASSIFILSQSPTCEMCHPQWVGLLTSM